MSDAKRAHSRGGARAIHKMLRNVFQQFAGKIITLVLPSFNE